jgi:hypothetical protein
MRFVELLRDVSNNIQDHNNDTVSSLLLTAADHIQNLDIYKLKWAELADRCLALETENETLLAQINTLRNQ